jgi:hypothetical protein
MRRPPAFPPLQVLEKLHGSAGNTNPTDITAARNRSAPGWMEQSGGGGAGQLSITIKEIMNPHRRAPFAKAGCRMGPGGLRLPLLRCRNLSIIERQTTGAPKTLSSVGATNVRVVDTRIDPP